MSQRATRLQRLGTRPAPTRVWGKSASFGVAANDPAKQARRKKRMQTARMWNDDSISLPMARTSVVFFAIGIMSAVLILLALILGFPASPLLGAWPTHGWYFQLPDCFLVFFIVVALGVQSERLVQVSAGLSVLATLLDIYSLVVCVYWFVGYYMNTLPTSARSHQTPLQTGPYVIVLLALVFMQVVALTSLLQVVFLLPDLKRHFGLGQLNDEGDFEEDEDIAIDAATVNEK
jgi:hypothetical protein